MLLRSEVPLHARRNISIEFYSNFSVFYFLQFVYINTSSFTCCTTITVGLETELCTVIKIKTDFLTLKYFWETIVYLILQARIAFLIIKLKINIFDRVKNRSPFHLLHLTLALLMAFSGEGGYTQPFAFFCFWLISRPARSSLGVIPTLSVSA